QVNYIENFMQDFRFAVRALRRSPILSAAAIFSLGVAIGANTAFFGVMDAVLSRSLPVQEPEQLVLLSWSAQDWPKRVLRGSMGHVDQGDGGIRGYTFSYPAFERLKSVKPDCANCSRSKEMGELEVTLSRIRPSSDCNSHSRA